MFSSLYANKRKWTDLGLVCILTLIYDVGVMTTPKSMCYQMGHFAEKSSVSATSRALLYGDGLFTTVHVHEGEPLYLEDNLAQLKWQCRELKLSMPIIERSTIYELIERAHLEQSGWMRIIIAAGDYPSRALPQRPSELIITLDPFVLPQINPLKLANFSIPLSIPHAHLKTLANFNRYFIVEEAQKRGFDDGISYTPEGYLLEASFGNLFWIVNETLYTPSKTLPLYFGVTLQNVIKRWKGQVCEVVTKRIEPGASVFRCSSMMGVVPIVAIEDQTFDLLDSALTLSRAF